MIDFFLFVTAGLAIKYLVKKAIQESAVGIECLMLANFSCFCSHLLTFFNFFFLKSFMNNIKVSNDLDPVSEILIWVQTVCKD